MNLGMLGAIGGAGKGMAEVGQANNMREMELFKMQAEQDMRDRAEERRMAMAGRVQQQARAANAADAQAVDDAYGKQQAQTQADTINSTNGSSVSPEDVATANAGNPLNASQRAAYGIEDPSRIDALGDKADISLRQGNAGLNKSYSDQQKVEIDRQNADTNEKLKQLQNRLDKGQGDTANHRDWQDWIKSKKAKGITDPAKLGYDDFYKFIKQMDLGNYKAYETTRRGVALDPNAVKPAWMQDGEGEEEAFKTYNPKTGKFE